jgi:hypothetical protein
MQFDRRLLCIKDEEHLLLGDFERMRAFVSIIAATAAGSLLLQTYFALWHPSSFGGFAEFPVVLLYASCITTASFLLFVVPGFFWLRRSQRSVSPLIGFLAGLLLGCIVMSIFMWPLLHPAYLVAGSIAGAVGVSIYARLAFKRVG